MTLCLPKKEEEEKLLKSVLITAITFNLRLYSISQSHPESEIQIVVHYTNARHQQ